MSSKQTYTKLNLMINDYTDGYFFNQDIKYNKKVSKQFNHYDNIDDVKNLLENDFNHYELFLENKLVNFVADLDITEPNDRENIKETIDKTEEILVKNLCKYCNELKFKINKEDINTIILKSPSTDKKDSYHMIFRIKDLYFKDITFCKNFYEYLVKNNIVISGLDNSIYKKNGSLRILNNSKFEFPERTLKLYKPESLENVLLTLASYCEINENTKIITETLKFKTKASKINMNENLEEFNDDNELIKKLLKCIDKKFATNYTDWNNLGICLYCITKGNQIGLKLWKDFIKSKNLNTYDAIECDNQWNGYSRLQKLNYTIGTLYYWAKNGDIKLYNEIFNEDYKSFLSGSEEPVANGFKRKNQHRFFFNDEDWFFFNETNGLWKKLNSPYKELHEAIKEFSVDLNLILLKIKNPNIKEALSSLIFKLQTTNYKKNLINELKIWMYVEDKNLNNNPYIFAFKDCVYDLENKCFRKGYFNEYITLNCGYNYRKETTDYAKQYLKSMYIYPEQYKYNLLLYSSFLDNVRNGENFWSKYNPKGANGKSVLITLFSDTFGIYCITPSSDMLYKNNNINSEGAKPELLTLRDKRIILFNESDKNKKFNTEFIKKITGGDRITARGVYSKNIDDFVINGKVILFCNQLPVFDEINPAITRRVKLDKVLARFVINPTKKYEYPIIDLDMDRLKYSFINLLIETYPEYSKLKEIPMTKQMLFETKKYFENSNYINRFIEDNIIEGTNDDFITREQLKRIFKDSDTQLEYSLIKVKFNDFINDIEIFLDKEFVRQKQINNKKINGIMTGYKLISNETENIEDDY